MEKVEVFYKAAGEYLSFITENKIKTESIPTLMKLLMNLYIRALDLPDMESETMDELPSNQDFSFIQTDKTIPLWYWEVFDPFTQEEPVCGHILDDLSDIAKDLDQGIKEYDAGRIGNAVFEWKFGFNNHWGSHVVDVLRAFHAIRTC